MKYWSEIKDITWMYKRISNTHKEIDNIMCFDIEVSSFFRTPQGEILSQNDILNKFKRLEKKKRYEVLSNYFSDCEKGSCCYIWQFGIENKGKFEIYFGRELKEFRILLDAINEDIENRCYIYIHNSAYEMQFLQNIFNLEKDCECFFTDKREPLYFRYGKIEFRCSYRLTNMSLASWGNQTEETQKTVLDYGTIRTPKTKLLKHQLTYCENDILIMYQGLIKYRDMYGSIYKIPYTQTGQPRGDIKKIYHNNKNYHERITKQLPLNYNEYNIQKRCYGGGLTIANAKKILDKNNKIVIHKNITNYDIASAYPYHIVTSNKFPSGRFRKCNKKLNELNFDKYCYLLGLKIGECSAKSLKHIIPRAKMPNRQGCKFDNGKLVEIKKGGYATLYCTEIDWKIFNLYYDFNESEIELIECYETTKSYLDKDFVLYVLSLYADKTKLKNMENDLISGIHYKDIYNNKKSVLNACYGMACTSLLFEPVTYINGVWDCKEFEEWQVDEMLLEKQYKSWKNILSFSTGIYVTSLQRANLCRMLWNISDNDWLYCDTDSEKMLHGEKYKKLFDEENKRIIKQLEQVAKERDIDIDLFMPKDINGVKHPIGVWEVEKPYTQAVFAGAKRYGYIDDKGEWHVTISGVPKCVSKHTTIKDFQNGFIFDMWDCENKKNIVTYLDGDNLQGVVLNKGKYDEYTVTETYGINMYPTGYRMTLEKDYLSYLSLLKGKMRK